MGARALGQNSRRLKRNAVGAHPFLCISVEHNMTRISLTKDQLYLTTINIKIISHFWVFEPATWQVTGVCFGRDPTNTKMDTARHVQN